MFSKTQAFENHEAFSTRLVRQHRERPAAVLELIQGLDNAGIGAGVVEQPSPVNRQIHALRLVDRRRRGIAECALEEHAHSVSDIALDHVERKRGPIHVLSKLVHRVCDVLGGIDQGAVQIEDDELHHERILPPLVPSLVWDILL